MRNDLSLEDMQQIAALLAYNAKDKQGQPTRYAPVLNRIDNLVRANELGANHYAFVQDLESIANLLALNVLDDKDNPTRFLSIFKKVNSCLEQAYLEQDNLKERQSQNQIDRIAKKFGLTVRQREQLISVMGRVHRINAGKNEEGDRLPGRLFADVEFLLSLISC